MISAIVIIFIAGGALLYLDCLGKQEQSGAMQSRLEIEKARSEAKRRASSRVSYDSKILTDLNICKAAAEKSKKDYLDLIPKAVSSKRGPYIIPQAVEAEATSILDAAKMECQQLYDARLKAGP